MVKSCDTCLYEGKCTANIPYGCMDYENKYGYPEPNDDSGYDDDDEEEED